jgi:hypothetical protein
VTCLSVDGSAAADDNSASVVPVEEITVADASSPPLKEEA